MIKIILMINRGCCVTIYYCWIHRQQNTIIARSEHSEHTCVSLCLYGIGAADTEVPILDMYQIQ